MNVIGAFGMRSRDSVSIAVALSLSFSLFLAPSASAGVWTITPRLGVRETYTDNLFLDSSGKGDFVTEVNPGILIRGETERLIFDLDYTLQNLIYADNDDHHTINHNLLTSGNAELVEQLLFVNAYASVNQQNINNTAPGAFLSSGLQDNINITSENDRRTVTAYGVSPYLMHHFGNKANVDLRFTYGDLDSESSGDAGGFKSQAMRYLASLTSGTHFTNFPWALTYDRQEIDYNAGTQTKLEHFLGELDYAYNRQFALVGAAGYENHVFEAVDPINPSQILRRDPSNVIWDVGFKWTPSARTSLKATYGQRFYGSRYFVDFAHRSRHITWLLNYQEEPFTTSMQQLYQSQLMRGGYSGRIAVDPITGDPILSTGGISPLSDDVFVRKLLSSGLIYEGRRNVLKLRGFWERRNFQNIIDNDQRLLGVDTQLTHRVGPRTDLNLGLGWSNINFTTPDREDDYVYVDLGIEHRLGRNVTGNVGYRRIERFSSDEQIEYDENRVMASILFSF
jgi:uncharacterized protein (PEP-CTERM system associated)